MHKADLQTLGHVGQQRLCILVSVPPLKVWYGMHWGWDLINGLQMVHTLVSPVQSAISQHPGGMYIKIDCRQSAAAAELARNTSSMCSHALS